ncbi:hypothetical protein BCV70DRAFT_71436 [Testicularia cyperi]|uniref:Uncharacterized protein n=1 Tax=Testicularia cyperi TaxID=1882483 RepID=A0A317XTQ5_9BASI|nr:hypothetical protein BCV70DRAFT_71436 [Testicularia cyperi]
MLGLPSMRSTVVEAAPPPSLCKACTPVWKPPLLHCAFSFTAGCRRVPTEVYHSVLEKCRRSISQSVRATLGSNGRRRWALAFSFASSLYHVLSMAGAPAAGKNRAETQSAAGLQVSTGADKLDSVHILHSTAQDLQSLARPDSTKWNQVTRKPCLALQQ